MADKSKLFNVLSGLYTAIDAEVSARQALSLATGSTSGFVYGGADVSITDGQITVLSAGQLKKSFTVFGKSFDGKAAEEVKVADNNYLTQNDGVLGITVDGTINAESSGLVTGKTVYAITSGLNKDLTDEVNARTSSDTEFRAALAIISGTGEGSITSAVASEAAIRLSNDKAISGLIEDLIAAGGNSALTGITTSGAISGTTASDHSLNIGLKIADDHILTQADGSLSAYVALSSITQTSGSQYASQYALVGRDGKQLGDTINIPRDQFLEKVEFKEEKDSLNDKLVFTFKVIDKDNNTYTTNTVDVPLSGLFNEYEGKNGISITNGGAGKIISGVVDSTSESYLTVGENGFKVSGVKDAIDSASNTLSGLISGAFKADEVVIGTGTALSASGYKIGDAISGDAAGDATKLITSKQVVDYVNEGLAVLDAKITALVEKI